MLSTNPERTRDVLLVLLGITTGATDVVAFERLGHVFASVITGNLILLGASGASGDGTTGLHAGVALAAYATGVLVASPRSTPLRDYAERPTWPASTTMALCLDFLLLSGFAVCWQLTDQHPGRGTQYLLLALAAAAMGVQSAAVRRMGRMSTTYLTSTLTAIVEALAAWRWSSEQARSVGIILAGVSGAAAGLALIRHGGGWLSAVQLAPLAIVLVAAPERAGLLSARIRRRMAYEPKVTVGAGVVLKDGRSGEIVAVEPDRPTESSYDEEIRVTVKLDDGEEAVVSPAEIEELTPPSGSPE